MSSLYNGNTPNISSPSSKSISELVNWAKDGDLELNPEYQRPSVWDKERQMMLIHSLLSGVPVPSLMINDRWEGTGRNMDPNSPQYAMIDGKQRLEAIIAWMDGTLRIPSQWVSSEFLTSSSVTVSYQNLTVAGQRIFKRLSLPVCVAVVGTVAEEAELFLTVNGAGVEQTVEDMERAKKVAHAA